MEDDARDFPTIDGIGELFAEELWLGARDGIPLAAKQFTEGEAGAGGKGGD
jgi:hypothetical protein